VANNDSNGGVLLALLDTTTEDGNTAADAAASFALQARKHPEAEVWVLDVGRFVVGLVRPGNSTEAAEQEAEARLRELVDDEGDLSQVGGLWTAEEGWG
jgi:hypothetical protein